MAFDFKRIGADGRLYFYYGVGQTWQVEAVQPQTIRVEACTFHRNQTKDGVQYYLISINGMIQPKPISASRLHYVLYCYPSEDVHEVCAGTPKQLPLMIEEVQRYFRLNENNSNCPICGGEGTKIDKFGARTTCARCTLNIQEEIKDYMAKLRIAELIGSKN